MRVIAGKAKGRPLATPRGIRPTTDRVKSALFSSLGDAVVGARVLDLYAGSGALGIEALSRGAAQATFIDYDERCLAAIESNLESTKLSSRAEVLDRAAELFIDVRRSPVWDIIFVDPPYEWGVISQVLGAIPAGKHYEKGLLSRGGIIVFETLSRSLPVTAPAGLEVYDEKVYGDTGLVFFREPAGDGKRR